MLAAGMASRLSGARTWLSVSKLYQNTNHTTMMNYSTTAMAGKKMLQKLPLASPNLIPTAIKQMKLTKRTINLPFRSLASSTRGQKTKTILTPRIGPLSLPFRTSTFSLNHHYRYSMILSPQLGAVSQFSSLGGGNPQKPPGGGSQLARGMGLVGAASVLFGKTKYLLAALKFTKLASLGSMLFTIGTYSMFFGWPYAAGMVGLIAVHEAGHALVLHQKGIPFSPAVFVPFMGAVIATKQLPRDAWEDAVVGYGGPALGSLGAGAVAVAAHATDSQLLYALSDFGFMINLFNLLPIGSMDGGRITGAISPYIGVAGLGVGGYLAYQGVISNPIFYLVLMSGGYETFMRFYDPASHIPPGYYNVSMTQRATMTVGYFGLIAALLVAMDVNKRYRKPPEVLIQEQKEKTWDMR